MEVNTNLSTIGSSAPLPPRGSATAAPAPAPKGGDSANLTSLDEAMQTLPPSRPDALERARTLAADPNYPPAEVLNKVSELLANKLAGSQQS